MKSEDLKIDFGTQFVERVWVWRDKPNFMQETKHWSITISVRGRRANARDRKGKEDKRQQQ